MPEDKTNNTADNTNDPVVPIIGADAPAETSDAASLSDNTMKEIAGKISEVHNILIALSSDPSVDEIAAAIGLSICLDRIGKRATSIYSGNTPNALEFLKPEKTFETSADVLKDFVVALDKNKADHLRYKLDGDFVKIFITPYKSRIDEDDLEFSYGDFNIEFVLSLNVANGTDLDDALREHGRVMHDATVANITTGNPGKFGDIEWSDKNASSVSEMAARLLYGIGGKDALTGEEATAFLTGIVAATEHFSNAKTTADSLKIAAELMKSGADRQLIAENISVESEDLFSLFPNNSKNNKKEDATSLVIEHDSDESDEKPETNPKETESEDSKLLADLEATAASLAAGDVTTKEAEKEPLRIDSEEPSESVVPVETTGSAETPSPALPSESAGEGFVIPSATSAPAPEATPAPETTPLETPAPQELTLTPSPDFLADNLSEGTSKYGQMLEEALAESNNPAASVAPEAPTEPEVNGVPEINYTTASNDEILPPPPTPPVDLNNTMPPNNP